MYVTFVVHHARVTTIYASTASTASTVLRCVNSELVGIKDVEGCSGMAHWIFLLFDMVTDIVIVR
jgi:hypothetical protein